MSVEDLGSFNPASNLFGEESNNNDKKQRNIIHLRVQQRNGRKTITTIQGLPKDLCKKKVLKVFKKDFACNGNIVEDEEQGEVIQLQGDHRTSVLRVLLEEQVAKKEDIQLHGF